MHIDFRLVCAVLSILLEVGGFFPYIVGMLRRKTTPHPYTWLIWGITEGTATVASYYGDGGYSTWCLLASTVVVTTIFLLSFRYGTANIKTIDTVFLVLALSAVLLWWLLKNPFIAVFMVSAIDGFGYFPSFRKTFEEPWSESLTPWIMFMLSALFALVALPHYNLLTTLYLSTILVADIILIAICLVRRPGTPRPSIFQ